MADLILIVEDEADIRDLLEYNLRQEGFETIALGRGDLVHDTVVKHKPALILLDLMLPGMSGIDICKQIRMDYPSKHIPIIMVTARESETDVVVGLELGADDYIPKPFSPKELVARVKAVLRRTRQKPQERLEIIEKGNLKLDLSAHKVLAKGTKLQLTLTEFNILKELMSHAGQVMTRSRLVQLAIGGEVNVTDRTIDVHLASLRKKLGAYGDMIETERGVGYRFKD